jgi:hypothetical protein
VPLRRQRPASRRRTGSTRHRTRADELWAARPRALLVGRAATGPTATVAATWTYRWEADARIHLPCREKSRDTDRQAVVY